MDSRALSSLPLPGYNGGGGGLGGGSPRPGEVCRHQGRRGLAQPGWSHGVGGPERRHAPWAGLPVSGVVWRSHPSLLDLLQKTPLVSAPDVPGKLLLHYPTTLKNPNSGSHPLCTLLSASLSSQSSALLSELPSWSSIPENTPPFPCLPLTLAASNPRLARPFRSMPWSPHPQLRTPSPLPPSASWKGAGGCHLGPRPRPPLCSGFWLHAPLPGAARGCASRFAPQSPGAPQPRALGRKGGRSPGWGWSSPALPRPPPSILRLPLTATPFPNLSQLSLVFLETIRCDSCRTKLERSVRWGSVGSTSPDSE